MFTAFEKKKCFKNTYFLPLNGIKVKLKLVFWAVGGKRVLQKFVIPAVETKI